MKNWIGIALAGTLFCGATMAQPIKFYVALNGNDNWSGKLPEPNATKTDGPFATLEKARDAVREYKKLNPKGITVYIRGGTYYLKQPFTLSPEDSGTIDNPIIYCNYKDEEVILSGGRPINDWQKDSQNLWKAKISDVENGEWYFRQLFVGDERQIRARTPNYDHENPYTGGWLFVNKPDENEEGTSVAKNKFNFKSGDIQPFPKSPEPEIHIFPAWGWVNAILSVDRIDFDKKIVYVKNRNCTQELRPGNRYFIENVFEALDEPGEWYLDRANGELYYLSKTEDFAQKEVVAPLLDRIIDIKGNIEEEDKDGFVEHITFRNLTFKHTKYSLEMDSLYTPDDGAIWMRGAQNCNIENCKFLCCGGYAIRLSSFSNSNKILGNSVLEAGQGGVLLVSDSTSEQPYDNTIAGNRIERSGKTWKHVAGIYVTTGSGNIIAHNTISDMPRYGISLKSFAPGSASHNNRIEYNRILRANLETNDTGAIETLGRDKEDTNNIIRYNLILDVIGLKTTESGEILTPFYTWGIYLDDYSSGVHVYGNIVARTVRGGIHVHLGRNNIIENNIFVDGQNQQVEFNGREFMANNKFCRNIVFYQQGALIRIQKWHEQVLAECDFNLYWQKNANLSEIDETITPEGTFSQWQASGYDKNSIVEKPEFVNPQDDNYNLNPDSPAFKIGFEPIDISQIGVRGFKP